MDKNQKQTSTWQELRSIFWVVVFAIMFRVLVIEPFFVPTGSMKATVLEQEYVFATKYSYGYSKYSLPFSPDLFSGRIFGSMPERGDIVITKSAHNMSTRFIKRVIGLPGDKIQIIDDVIYINNEAIKRTELGTVKLEGDKKYIKFREVLPSGVTYFAYKLQNPPQSRDNYTNFGPYYVPQEHFFLLGDNRDESGDSRYQIGFVPFEYLIAKAQFILLSTKEMFWENDITAWQQVKRLGTWLANIRFTRTFHSLYEKDYVSSEPEADERSESDEINTPKQDDLEGDLKGDLEAKKTENLNDASFEESSPSKNNSNASDLNPGNLSDRGNQSEQGA